MWLTESVPVDNARPVEGEHPFRVLPPTGGVTVLMCQRPPDDAEHVGSPIIASGGDVIAVDSTHPGMHATNTEDYS